MVDGGTNSLWDCCCGSFFLAVLLILGSFVAYSKYAAKRRRDSWRSQKRDLVLLHCPGRGRYAPSMSPFVIKLESYLRLVNIPYKVDFEDPIGPKGKTPWITFNGEHLSDSQLVMEFLGRKFAIDKSLHLTSEMKAISKAFSIMMDEHLIWGLRVWRYDIDKCNGFAECMGKLPFTLRVGRPLLSKKMRNVLWHQGIGRHNFGEVIAIVRKDLDAVSMYLGKKSFLMGEEPSEVDCIVFAHLANILFNYRRSPFYQMITEDFPNLEAYVERFKERLWPDWNMCIEPPAPKI